MNIFRKFFNWYFTNKHTKEMIAQGLTKCKCCGHWVKALAEVEEKKTFCLICWYSHFLGSALIKGGDIAKYDILPIFIKEN